MAEKTPLQKLRKQCGRTSQYVADMLGISRSSLYNKEKGRSPVYMLEAEKLAELYNVSVDKIQQLAKR